MLLPGSPRLYIYTYIHIYYLDSNPTRQNTCGGLKSKNTRNPSEDHLRLTSEISRLPLSLKPITRAPVPVLPFYILWYGYKEPAAVLP
jgi:hypothetical protein